MEPRSPPAAQEYVVPTYAGPNDTSWYHFLHGNVPRHQIDFIYRPVVPQARLSQQHFSHLSRLMKYIEPQTYGGYAFCIGNLSRDDVQYEPGHGGIALIFSMRILGAMDHAGRPDPPFTHAVAAVDREITPASLLQVAMSFHRHMQFDSDSEAAGRGWYHTYARCAMDNPDVVEHLLQAYVADFDDLPQTVASTQGAKWTAAEGSLPKRIIIVRPDDCPFEDVAWCAARIAAMLCRSDIRWTSITNGREADIPGGVSIRILTEQEAGNPEPGELRVMLNQVADQEADLAVQLFAAKVVSSSTAMPSAQPNWRELYQAQRSAAGASAPAGSDPGDVMAQERAKFPSTPPPRAEASSPGDGGADPFRGQVAEEIKRYRERRAEREAVDFDTPAAGHPHTVGPASSPVVRYPSADGVASPVRHEGAFPSNRAPPAPQETATTNAAEEPHRSPLIWPWILLAILCVVGLPVAYFLIAPDDPASAPVPSAAPAPVDAPKPGASSPPPSENKPPAGAVSALPSAAPPTPGDNPAAAQGATQPVAQGAAPAGTSSVTTQPAPLGTGKKPVKKEKESVFGGELKLGGSKKR